MRQNRRSVLNWTLIPGALLLLTAACAADRPPSGSAWAGEIHNLPNGAVLVTNPEAGIWSPGDGWQVLETLRIGQLDGDGPDVFGRIDAFTVDAAGRIYVLDGQAHEIRTFDVDGRFLRRFGRRGGGPGELASAIGMRQAQDGTLWVVDPGNARYLGLTERDTLTQRRPTPLYDLPWVGGFTTDGDFLYDGPVHVANGDPRAQYILRIDVASSAVDTIPIPTPDLPRPSLGGITLPLPYAPTALRAFDERGATWIAISDDYRLAQVSFTGDTLRVVTRAFTASALTGTQRDSITMYVRNLEQEFPIKVSGGMIPTTAPILRWFVLDDRGNLWVCRAGEAPCSRLDVFDEAGRYMGEVVLPFEVREPVLVRENQMYAVVEGEAGEPVLVRARIDQRY